MSIYLGSVRLKREIFSPKLFIDARVRQYIGAEIGNHIVTYVGTGGENLS